MSPIPIHPGADITVTSSYIENLSPVDCLREVRRVLAVGASSGSKVIDLWVIPAAEHLQCMQEILKDSRWPFLKIVTVHPGTASERVAAAYPSSDSFEFLHGMLCALSSRTQTVGFVASLPRTVSASSRALTAFALGARYAKPNIRVVAAIAGTYLDDVAETKATNKLIDEAKADCIGNSQNDLTVHKVASKRGVYSVGTSYNARFFIDESVLSTVSLRYDRAIAPFYMLVANRTWISNYTFPMGIDPGGTSLNSLSTKVKPEWIAKIDETTLLLRNRTLNFFCSTYLKDTKWMTPEMTYHTNSSGRCLRRDAIYNMKGIIDIVDVLVEYNDQNSPYTVAYIKWNSLSAIFVLVVSAVHVIVAISSAVLILGYAHHPVIRGSSPFFLLLILLGVIIGSVSPIARIGRPTAYKCMANWWFTGIAHALIWSCLIAKHWRIWRIYSSANLRTVTIFNGELVAKWVAFILFVEIVILTFWTVFAAHMPNSIPMALPTTKIDQMQIVCSAKPGRAMKGFPVWVAYNVAIMIPAAVLSYWTRNANQEYQETKSIAAAIYSTWLTALVLATVGLGLPRNFQTEFYLTAYGTFFIMFIIWASLFFPKFTRVRSSLSQAKGGRRSSRIKDAVSVRSSEALRTINTRASLSSDDQTSREYLDSEVDWR